MLGGLPLPLFCQVPRCRCLPCARLPPPMPGWFWCRRAGVVPATAAEPPPAAILLTSLRSLVWSPMLAIPCPH